jgi:hypothetical protein
MDRLLKKLYNDPRTGFVSAQKLYLKAREIRPTITLKQVRDWLSNQSTVHRFQEQKPASELFKIASSNPNSWQADLTFWRELDKQPILTAVNINSRVGYAKILPNKQAKTMLTAIKEFLATHKVTELTTDNGTEFTSATAEKFFKANNIEHYNNEPGDHNRMGMIERFSRTIKQSLIRIERKLTPKLLADVIHNYNTTENSAIGQTPEEATGTVDRDVLDHNEEVMKSLDEKLTVGDSVRYRLTKGTFAKEGARWSKDVYRYEGLDGYKADIRSKNGHIKYVPLNGIKVVNAKVTSAVIAPREVMEIDMIMDHRSVKGKFRYLVKWKQMEDPTWEPQANLRHINKNRISTTEKIYWDNIAAEKQRDVSKFQEQSGSRAKAQRPAHKGRTKK